MIRRVFVSKKKEFAPLERKLLNDFKNVLSISAEDVRVFIRYDIEDINDEIYKKSLNTIFSERPVDDVFENELPNLDGYEVFVTEYLPGQYDQRADSAEQCVSLLSMQDRPTIKCANVYAIKGINKKQLAKIKKYLINPVETREGSHDKKDTLKEKVMEVADVAVIDGFKNKSDKDIEKMYKDWSFAMSLEDLKFVRDYFKSLNRDATETELRVIDTYWSDHCRHTTFNTELTSIEYKGKNEVLKDAINKYNEVFDKYNKNRKDKYKSLMSMATIAVKHLRAIGKLENIDVSEEINACSINVKVDNDGVLEDWLIMFKNETHNHPTEIEPFGGAATCLGGAIRDPLSGRTYVYQAMRVTGAADPTKSLNETLQGKLPQRVITTTAAHGYSSYGNQIGLATGLVDEMYHERYVAKRLETGFVIAGAPKENVIREVPQDGDIIILLGGDTGRDGCGGATGSSKSHQEDSVATLGAEVQKGNPTIERKIQRLFRNKEVAKMIIRCNDFGAGGVSVAIGELADGLDINLDKVPKKYEGLTGTELAISESQERMAVVVKKENVKKFIKLAAVENLKATEVAIVTSTNKMRMIFKGKVIVELDRSFLDTNGVKQLQDVVIAEQKVKYFEKVNDDTKQFLDSKDYKKAILNELSRLNVCSKKGLGEMFDSTIGASTVLMPFAGKTQMTPACVMAAKPPVSSGKTSTVTVSSYACYPYLMEESPFIGAIYSIVGSVTKQIIAGVPYSTIYLTLQEYFKKLGRDKYRWGEPTAALLGAFYAQLMMKLGAIGGKDSMSGTFENIDVVPTLISFAVGVQSDNNIISNHFTLREDGKNSVYHIPLPRDKYNIPKFDELIQLYERMTRDILSKKIVAANIVEEGGILSSVIKSCLGDMLGFDFEYSSDSLFMPKFSDIVVQVADGYDLGEKVGELTSNDFVKIDNVKVKLRDIVKSFVSKLDNVFPQTAKASGDVKTISSVFNEILTAKKSFVTPRVFIPAFPGTNCEYDTARAFELNGAKADIFVVKNQNSSDINYSVDEIVKYINKAQIIAFPGGFSGGDEPDGSGKFIATTFRNPKIQDAIAEFLNKRDGLIIGICNGFQALIKLGLVPYGKIIEQTKNDPTLTFNNISRHVSTISKIRVSTNKTPWFNSVSVGDVFNVAVSHGEGRFVASNDTIEELIINGQIATQYVDDNNNATMLSPYNPNGSIYAIEGIISADGRVLGKMGHAERIGNNLYKNVDGNYDMKLFESGVKYFK